MSPDLERALFLAGPTAVGKSVVALAVAEALGGEIISVDSMQVYRGLDLGTAKPTPAERARVPHHLLDVVAVTEPFTAADFVQQATASVAAIRQRGRVPVFCGGTGLYFKALLEGLGTAPAPDPRLRAELEQTPLPALLAELARNDPATFARIDRQNPRRIVRAVEIVRLTGKPASTQRASWSVPDSAGRRSAVPVIGLSRAPADLHARIQARVEAMFAGGLVAETRVLLGAGLERNRTAMQAIGYRQVAEHLRGERDLATTIALVIQKTRQFARRQMTWLRHQLPVHWLELTRGEPPGVTAQRILDLLPRIRSQG